jgi:hypothetical protein
MRNLPLGSYYILDSLVVGWWLLFEILMVMGDLDELAKAELSVLCEKVSHYLQIYVFPISSN